MPFSAGTVFLEVVPSFNNFQRAIRAQTSGLGKAVAGDIDRDMDRDMDRSGTRAGERFSGAFISNMQTKLKSAISKIGDVSVNVDADIDPAKRELAKLLAETKTLADLKIGVQVSGEAALNDARHIEAGLSAILHDEKVDVNVRMDASEAMAALVALRTAVQRSLGPTPEENAKRVAAAKAAAEAQKAAERDISTNLERQLARRNAALVAAKATEAELSKKASASGNSGDLTRAVAAIEARYAAEKDAADDAARERIQAAAKGYVGEKAAAEMAQQSVEESYKEQARAAAAAGAARMAIARVTSASERAAAGATERNAKRSLLAQNTGQAANSFRIFNGYLLTALALGPLLIPVLAVLAGGFGALGVAIMGPILGIGVLVAGLSGIGGAVTALGALDKEKRKNSGAGATASKPADTRGLRDAQEALARANEDAGSRIAEADKRRADAQEALARASEEAGRRIAEADKRRAGAQESLARASEDANRRIADANDRRADSEKALAQAVKSATDAQNDLIEARRTAAQELEDQNARLKSTLIDEQLGGFQVQEAGYRLNAVLEDPQASQREKDIALLQYDKELQAYEDLRRENRRLETEVAKANAAGVEGSKRVVDAKTAIINVDEQIVDAQRAVAEAEADVASARIEGARALVEAQENLAEAEADIASARIEEARSLVGAQEDLADAEADVARARVEEARTMADAERGVADAMLDLQEKSVAAGEAGSTAMNSLNEAMLGLSPAGQAFARFIYSLKPFLDDLRFAAQEGILPGLQTGLQTLIDAYGPDLIRFIGEMATLLGDLFERGALALTAPFWRNFFEMVEKYAPIFLEAFASIGGSLLEMIAGIMIAFAPFAEDFMAAFVVIAQGLAEWGKGLVESEAFKEFLDYVRERGPIVAETLLALATVLLNLMIGMAPYADKLLEVLLGFLNWLAGMDPTTLAIIVGILGALVLVFQLLAGTMSIVASAVMLGMAGSTVAIIIGVGLAIVAIAGLIVWFIYLMNTNQEFHDAVMDIWNQFKVGVETVVNAVVSYFQRLSDFIETYVMPVFNFLWYNIISPGLNFVMGMFNIFWQVVSTVFNMVSQIIEFIIMPIFRAFGDVVSDVYDNTLRPIFDALAKIIEETVAPAFQIGVDAITAIWNGLIEAAKVPVRFVVETVINKGIIGTFNKLVDLFPGMTKVDDVKLPDGFKDGGTLPGYTPGRDVHQFYSPTAGRLDLSGGEGILRPEATGELGSDWINGINSAARNGGRRGVQRYLGGFGDGGILGWLGNAAETVTDTVSSVVSSVTGFLDSPAGALRSLVDSLFSGFQSTGFAGIMKSIPLMLIDAIAGLFNGKDRPALATSGGEGMGWQAMSDLLASTFPDAHVTSAFRPGAITAVGSRSLHGFGRAIDIAPPSMEIFNWLHDSFPGAKELLYSPAGGSQLINGRETNTSGVTKRNHYCVPLDVKILTRRGWVTHDEVIVGVDETLGMNFETERLEWTSILAMNTFDDAEVFETGTRQAWRVRATANHRWINRNFATGRLGWTTTDSKRQAPWVVAAPMVDGRGLDLTLDEAELLGWLVTDGGQHDGQHHGGRNFSIHAWQTKPQGVARLSELLGERASWNGKGYRLRNSYSLDLLRRAGISHIKNGAELVGMLYAMTSQQRDAVLAGVKGGDGCGNGGVIAQDAGPLCDFISLLGYLTGHRVMTKKREDIGDYAMGRLRNGVPHLVSLSRPHASTYRSERRSLGEMTVWCPTTANGSWTAEFGQGPVLTGNSHIHWGMKDGGVIPNLYDNGGYLPPGLSMVANQTGKPEQVFTADQAAQLRAAAGRGASGGTTVKIDGDVNGGEYLIEQLVNRIETKRRDAAALYRIDTLGVAG